MTVGTVAYAAPEQLTGAPMDGRADQYALAAMTFHLLTGAQLFPNSNAAVVIGRHLSTPPPSLDVDHPELAMLDAAMQRALAKNPQDRYPTCTALAQALGSSSTAMAPNQATALAPMAPHIVPGSGVGVPPSASTARLSQPQPEALSSKVADRQPAHRRASRHHRRTCRATVVLVARPWEDEADVSDRTSPAPAPAESLSAPTASVASPSTRLTAAPHQAGLCGMTCPHVPP
jgi:serine/threonine protein kinase